MLRISKKEFVHINRTMKNKVWYYRTQKVMSLKQLSRMTGISVAELNNIENECTSDILLSNAIALSKSLKVDLYELFCLTKLY